MAFPLVQYCCLGLVNHRGVLHKQMFYNELPEKYLLGTCQGIHSVFLRYLCSCFVVST